MHRARWNLVVREKCLKPPGGDIRGHQLERLQDHTQIALPQRLILAMPNGGLVHGLRRSANAVSYHARRARISRRPLGFGRSTATRSIASARLIGPMPRIVTTRLRGSPRPRALRSVSPRSRSWPTSSSTRTTSNSTPSPRPASPSLLRLVCWRSSGARRTSAR